MQMGIENLEMSTDCFSSYIEFQLLYRIYDTVNELESAY
jgi:hypothetical protein